MIYQAYQSWADLSLHVRGLAAVTASTMRLVPQAPPWWAGVASAWELAARMGLRHHRAPFGIDRVAVGGRDVAVHEEIADRTPFATLLRFRKDDAAREPRVLLVAPMSGHFATLLRGTVRTMLPEHDVHITDWHNARDVALAHGPFGFDEFIEHVVRFLEVMGPGSHVVAVCQPCAPVLAGSGS